MTVFKTWFRSLRVYSFTASVMPVLISASYIQTYRDLSLVRVLLTVSAVLLVHMGVNVLNDHADYMNNVDMSDSHGSSGVIQNGLMSERAVFVSGHIYLLAAFFIGLYLSGGRGDIILFGMVCFISAYFYTSTIFSLKYWALGEILVFSLLGPGVFIFTELVLSGYITDTNILLSIPVGILVTEIMLGNNIRDITVDRRKKIITFPMLVGKRTAGFIYVILLAIAYFWVVFWFNDRTFFWIILFSVPVALKNISCFISIFKKKGCICSIDRDSALLHFLFGISVVLVFVLDGVLS